MTQIAAAAGGGAEVLDETPLGHLSFQANWLARHGINPIQSTIISIAGESMEPTLPEECTVLVDRSRRRRRAGHLYVLRTEDGLVVRRAGRNSTGHWELRRDHPAWEPVAWPRGTEVIGEVQWAARTFSEQF